MRQEERTYACSIFKQVEVGTDREITKFYQLNRISAGKFRDILG